MSDLAVSPDLCRCWRPKDAKRRLTTVHELDCPARPAELPPPPAGALKAVRLFRFTATVLIPSAVEDTPIYTTPALTLVDEWDGNSGRACVALEEILTRMLLRGASRRVRVDGGYIS